MVNSSTRTVLVTGATANTGSALLRLLEERGVTVRAMVRDDRAAAKLGKTSASIVFGNFDDASSVAAALVGVDSAYLVTPSSADAQAQQIRFAELAAEAGIEHLVKLSQFAAVAASPVRFLRYHAAVEQRIRELGIGYTFLRPNLYFQGFLSFASMIASDRRFFAPIGDARVSAVDVRDIAMVAAVALTEPGHIGKTYTITGPATLTHSEVAHAIGQAIGREIKFVDTSPDDFAFALRKFGMPAWRVDGLIEDYAHYARGEAAEVHPTVRDVTGRAPRDVGAFTRDYASAFGSQS
jgi:uncharacterized protein YbjT (DUF2867 family)